MSLTDIKNIKIEYQTIADNIIEDFYIPCLKEAVVYKRAVGFFSSAILLQISRGISALMSNGGKIQLIISPKLEKEDFEAIKNGYDMREIVENRMLEQFDESIEFEQKEGRFSMLAHLISNRILDVKIAIPNSESSIAMFHEKEGIIKDRYNNIVAFSGSANETINGFIHNYENIDVFCSWKSLDAEERCNAKDMRFDRLWDQRDRNVTILPFPEVIKNKILKYEKNDIDYVKLDEDYIESVKNKAKKEKLENYPCLKVELFEYQNNAISKWKEHEYKGIFDMATGTGKTFTALGAACQLFNQKKRLFLVICCPFVHLVDQWEEEAEKFNIKPICCHGSTEWEENVKRQSIKFRQQRTNFVCLIVCNNTFKNEKIQKVIKENLNDCLLIVDEAHNFGAKDISKYMNLEYPYRLGLSATINRHGDPSGTQKIIDFFGNVCYEYSLKEAIDNGKLTRYLYYPVLIYLNETELDEYIDLTKKLVKTEDEDVRKKLLIKRARKIACAKNKVPKLMELIDKYKTQDSLLIYCGVGKSMYDDGEIKSEETQIRDVVRLLTEKNMMATKFTSEESRNQRLLIKKGYESKDIQVLVAMKCLDEGVNIPSIKTAFILASSTNPKEYIQRRGRVLRRCEGKEYAEIYDFITLPFNPETYVSDNIMKLSEGLIKRELSRVIEFADLSNNPSYSNEIIDNIKNIYGIDNIFEEEELYE